ncbi:MAG TPA: O-antigen ligase family protein [Thermoanaerobaculia bacterium]
MPFPQASALAIPSPGGFPAGSRSRAAWRPRRSRVASGSAGLILFMLLHVPLVMAVRANPTIATAHALAVGMAGLAALGLRTPERLIYVMGYAMASEPLWRIGKAMVFYESAKYLIAGLSILGILCFRLSSRTDKTPLVYFALLLPSLLVLPGFDRQQISFNMSGPFALAMCTLFLSALRVSTEQLRKLILTILAPILGLVVVATFATVTTEELDYGSKVASGGLGNNQASSYFGLGLLLGFLYLFVDRRQRTLRWLAIVVAIWCGAQAALTFSRGGVATAVGAIAAASFFLLRDRRARGALVARIGLLAVLAVSVVVPQLNAFTEGALERRFTDTHLTGRDRIIEADLIAFRENPLFGVGPGESKAYHALTFRRSSSHTEYSRLLAEHGLFGLAALALLGWMVFRRLVRSSSSLGTAMAAGFTVWTLLFMFHAAMRMAAASFIFALGAVYLATQDPQPSRMRLRRRRTFQPPRDRLERAPRSAAENGA